MTDSETLLKELDELINGKAFLQADYDAILIRIQALEIHEEEERLSLEQLERLRILRLRI